MNDSNRSSRTPSLAVIGVGNPYRGDDGIGIYLMEQIKQDNTIDQGIEYIDGGIGGMNLFHKMSSYPRVLLVDAVNCGKQPGDYVFFSAEAITSSNKMSSLVSTHGSDLFEVIQQVRGFNEHPPDIYVFGVQPEDVSLRKDFSEGITKNLSVLVSELKQRIDALI